MSDGKPSADVFEGYKKGEDVPLFSYGVLVGIFNLSSSSSCASPGPRDAPYPNGSRLATSRCSGWRPTS